MRALSVGTTAVLAITLPALLAFNISPSATFFNQALALAGWGVFMAFLSAVIEWPRPKAIRTAVWPVASALGILVVVTMLSHGTTAVPWSLALSSAGLVLAAMCVLVVATAVAHTALVEAIFKAFCLGLVIAGAVSLAVAFIQYFMPQWADGNLIAPVAASKRAGGNLRQPNHLSSLLLWSMVGLVYLHDASARQRSLTRGLQAVVGLLLCGLILGAVLTSSRTGAVCIILLAFWGLLDKNLSRFARVLLLIAPVIYLLSWLGMSQGTHEFSGNAQLHRADPSSSRFGIWANSLSLIARNPWFGVGPGEFNFAWTLTPFPGRPVAFFDHTHNLPLQVLVELGLPLGALFLGLLSWSFWRATSVCRHISISSRASIARAAYIMVLMMVVHSMLEYPLWYAYFLLPTAFAFGICLGSASPQSEGQGKVQGPHGAREVLFVASAVMVLGTVLSVGDYLRVARIFSVDENDDTPLSARIAEGQKSIFFAHHADYAAATVATHPSEAWSAFKRAPHLLLDTRLMMAWAKGYAEKGDVERARYIADRLREFRNPDSAEFFAQCDKPRPRDVPEPFQCKPATRHFTYEDFKLR